MMKEHDRAEELNTWQEIAGYLNVGIRTAQNYEKQMGLPVRRVQGGRGRVIAYKGELDRWKFERFTGTVPEGASVPEQPRAQVPPRPRRIFLTLRWNLMIAATLVALAAIYFFRPRLVPVTYKLEVSTLITLDSEGREVWRYKFPEPINEPFYSTLKDRLERGIFADLDGTGEVNMYFRYCPAAKPTETTLYCFSQAGKEKWRFVPGRPIVTDVAGDRYYPPFPMNTMQLITNHQTHRARIAVSSHHHVESPDQVGVLDSRGNLVGEYWHPGHLLHMEHADLDHDGKEEILMAGVNNAYRSATLIVFDPENVHGTSDVSAGPRPDFGFKGFSRGTEKAIVFFPRTCFSQHKAFNRVRSIQIFGNQIYVDVSEDVADASNVAILYTLDFSLNVVNVEALPSTPIEHRNLEKKGELDHSLTAEEIAGWKRAVVVIKR